MGRKRRSELHCLLDRQLKRLRVEEQLLELFDNEAVEIGDPRNNTPTQIVKTLWHCLTSLTPATNPCRNTEKKYRNEVFDWWDAVKQNQRIGSSLVRARLLTLVKTKHLKKLGILDILYDSHCPSSPTANDRNVATSISVSFEAVLDTGNIRPIDNSIESDENSVEKSSGRRSPLLLDDGGYVNSIFNDDDSYDGEYRTCDSPFAIFCPAPPFNGAG